MGNWKYDNQDPERLSLIMTLHYIGYTTEEVEKYMRILLEKQLERLDYLRYEIQ